MHCAGGGVYLPGGVPWVYLPGGVPWVYFGGGVPAGRCIPACNGAGTPPVDRQTLVTSNAFQHCVVPSCSSGFSGSGHNLDSCILIC